MTKRIHHGLWQEACPVEALVEGANLKRLATNPLPKGSNPLPKGSNPLPKGRGRRENGSLLVLPNGRGESVGQSPLNLGRGRRRGAIAPGLRALGEGAV